MFPSILIVIDACHTFVYQIGSEMIPAHNLHIRMLVSPPRNLGHRAALLFVGQPCTITVVYQRQLNGLVVAHFHCELTLLKCSRAGLRWEATFARRAVFILLLLRNTERWFLSPLA